MLRPRACARSRCPDLSLARRRCTRRVEDLLRRSCRAPAGRCRGTSSLRGWAPRHRGRAGGRDWSPRARCRWRAASRAAARAWASSATVAPSGCSTTCCRTVPAAICSSTAGVAAPRGNSYSPALSRRACPRSDTQRDEPGRAPDHARRREARGRSPADRRAVESPPRAPGAERRSGRQDPPRLESQGHHGQGERAPPIARHRMMAESTCRRPTLPPLLY